MEEKIGLTALSHLMFCPDTFIIVDVMGRMGWMGYARRKEMNFATATSPFYMLTVELVRRNLVTVSTDAGSPCLGFFRGGVLFQG